MAVGLITEAPSRDPLIKPLLNRITFAAVPEQLPPANSRIVVARKVSCPAERPTGTIAAFVLAPAEITAQAPDKLLPGVNAT